MKTGPGNPKQRVAAIAGGAPRSARRSIPVLLGLLLLPASGCLERRIHITTEPPGAVVTLNEVEIGRTPVSTGFTYYGVYDVRIRKEGYEPITTGKSAVAPWYEYPGIDLLGIAAPTTIRTDLNWHWDLVPVPPGPDPELPVRARELRSELGAAPPATKAPAAPPVPPPPPAPPRQEPAQPPIEPPRS